MAYLCGRNYFDGSGGGLVMVTTVTNLGRSGLYDWLMQRASALVLAAYTIFIISFLISTPNLTYDIWLGLFSQFWMRVFSLIALLSTAIHGWIGLWTVATDYLTKQMMGSPATFLRLLVLGIYALVTVIYVIWGIEILWGLN